MLPCRIYSILGETWLGLSNIGISGSVRSENGVGQLLETRRQIPAAYMSKVASTA